MDLMFLSGRIVCLDVLCPYRIPGFGGEGKNESSLTQNDPKATHIAMFVQYHLELVFLPSLRHHDLQIRK